MSQVAELELHVDLPLIPDEDLAGSVGPRLLRLLSVQVERNLECLARDRAEAGTTDPIAIATDIPYAEYFLGGSACAFATLARFGAPGAAMAGTTREQLDLTAVHLVEAAASCHPLGGGTKPWSRFNSARILYLLGTGAWLVWDRLSEETRQLVASILAEEADRYLDAPAPAQLYDDTQAESNAWIAGGLAVVSCMLKQHAHRELWDDKAKEYMISAYATADDVGSDRIVDGKPLREWLTGPNAFPDCAVENHGFVHPDYLAAVSEMVRSAIAYRLAGEPLPEAVTFNAEDVFDLLALMLLPDGTHLYVQGTDYTPRRVDSFFQACNVVLLKPSPLRMACFLRSLECMEKMAAAASEIPLSGWVGAPYDLGSTWGLAQNYLLCRLFGVGEAAIPDDQLEVQLAGVHHSEGGDFAIHRTPTTLSTFSWHSRTDPPKVMGMTMPLDRDVLCYPMPWSVVGEVRARGEDAATLTVESHHLDVAADGFSAMLEFAWCGGQVTQDCAFISLPDGVTVYLEDRRAAEPVDLAMATSGTVHVFDDLRWPHQTEARVFHSAHGAVDPNEDAVHVGNWLNVDDRMGYVVLGCDRFRLTKHRGRPCLWRGSGTMYDTCRLDFTHVAPEPGPFAMVTCADQTADRTRALAVSIAERGWAPSEAGALALALNRHVVYANFATEPRTARVGSHELELPARSCGWHSCPGECR